MEPQPAKVSHGDAGSRPGWRACASSSTHLWPLNFPGTSVPLPSGTDPRSGTSFDPDPDGGDELPLPEALPTLRLAG